jgi:poly-gamma-glutamate capsule biosynthesis protein CapA/YwtB (metallophosphatase superfamily)
VEAAEQMAPLEIGVALLANNHIFDELISGFEATRAFLRRLGIHYLGAGLTPEEAQAPLRVDVNGVPITFLNYVDPETNPRIPPNSGMFLNELQPERVVREIREEVASGRAVIVCVHWGLDLIPHPSPAHRRLARAFTAAGARVVAGSHAHCLKAYEITDTHAIFYDLGNFYAGALYPWPRFSRPTMVATCAVSLSGVETRSDLFASRRGLLKPLSPDAMEAVQARRNRRLLLDDTAFHRAWSLSVLWHLAVFRPLHFLQRQDGIRSIIRNLRARHLTEYRELLSGLRHRIGG